MQYVNDDMDEQFRKAAENYPLDTSGADWNKVARELEASNSAGEPQRKKNRGRFLWLLLLIPVGLAGMLYFRNTDTGAQASSDPSSKSGEEAIPAEKNASANTTAVENQVTEKEGNVTSIAPSDQRSSSGNRVLATTTPNVTSGTSAPMQETKRGRASMGRNLFSTAITSGQVGRTSQGDKKVF